MGGAFDGMVVSNSGVVNGRAGLRWRPVHWVKEEINAQPKNDVI